MAAQVRVARAPVSEHCCFAKLFQDIASAPGARWAGSGLPLPFGAETPLPLPLPACGCGWMVAEACRGLGWLG